MACPNKRGETLAVNGVLKSLPNKKVLVTGGRYVTDNTQTTAGRARSDFYGHMMIDRNNISPSTTYYE